MKYERAQAELSFFSQWKEFLSLSKGAYCELYGIIDQNNGNIFSCFIFYLGSYDSNLNNHKSKCDDVTSPGGTCEEIRCYSVDQLYGQLVQ